MKSASLNKLKAHVEHTDIKPFMDDNFLLNNRVAEILYHEHARLQPIIDFHNHLPPDEIAADRRFENLTQIWLHGDHYKWRAMRTAGIDERYITGDTEDADKFRKWAEVVPQTIRNPLFHWTHLELKRYFGISELLTSENAHDIYTHCNRLLQTDDFSTQQLLKTMHVETVCTTDDPADDLVSHRHLVKAPFGVTVLPTFRPDQAIQIGKPTFHEAVQRLGASVDSEVQTFAKLLEALRHRALIFNSIGCKLSDHGLEQIYASPFTDAQADLIFRKRISGQQISVAEEQIYMSAILYHLGCLYAELGWVQQFHLGALRNNNSRMLKATGPDTGFDSIGDFSQAPSLAAFLNQLDSTDQLAKTILYTVNPADNAMMATMAGNFNDGSVKGKVQFGPAWWFLDQLDGMEQQLNTLSQMSLLSRFVGMVTDSRSFLSFPRHEYFRRVLCNLLGKDVHNGQLPNDTKWLGSIVEDICYNNAKTYFGF